MKFLTDFDLFINPYPKDINIFDYYDFLDYNCLEPCSYVHYFYLRTINGEIDSKPIPIRFSDIKYIIYDDVAIIAFNHLDNIAMFVDIKE